MLAEGQQLSHYRLVRLLKSGGMGEVYLAVDTLLHRQVAIKVINTDALRYAETDAEKDAARLFLREAQAIAQLDQTNILPLYDSGEQIVDGISLMYMVMPYRQAGSLADWKRTHFGNHLLPLVAAGSAIDCRFSLPWIMSLLRTTGRRDHNSRRVGGVGSHTPEVVMLESRAGSIPGLTAILTYDKAVPWLHKSIPGR